MNTVEKFELASREGSDQKIRISLLESNMIHVNESMHRLESQFNKIDRYFDNVDNKLERIRSDIVEGKKENWSQMRWILAFVIALFGSPVIYQVIKSISFRVFQ